MPAHAIIDKTTGWMGCGPVVVAALTGSRLTVVEDLFRMTIGSSGRSTTASDLDQVLRCYGLRLTLGHLAAYGEERRLWWVLRFFPDDSWLIIAIEERGDGHWVTTHGWRLADTHTNGRWIARDDHGLHADALVDAVWIVEPG
jgi:hypothetical protein